MKFQIYSDIHLEFFTVEGKLQKNYAAQHLPEIPVLCDNLALLGDIGYPSHKTYRDFVLLQASRFKRVFIVAGNHEYYRSSIQEVDAALTALAALKPNIYLLNGVGHEFEEDGVVTRVLGTTLWTFVPDQHKDFIRMALNDYRQIRVLDEGVVVPPPSFDTPKEEEDDNEIPQPLKGRLFTIDDSIRLHRLSVGFLEEEIKRAKKDNANVVIFTHHGPTGQHSTLKKPAEDEKVFEYAEYTDLEHLMGPPVLLWGFGHTHYSSRQLIRGTMVVSNQLGYVHPVMDHFDPNFKVDLVINASSFQQRQYEDYLPCIPQESNFPRHMSKKEEVEYARDAAETQQRRARQTSITSEACVLL